MKATLLHAALQLHHVQVKATPLHAVLRQDQAEAVPLHAVHLQVQAGVRHQDQIIIHHQDQVTADNYCLLITNRIFVQPAHPDNFGFVDSRRLAGFFIVKKKF